MLMYYSRAMSESVYSQKQSRRLRNPQCYTKEQKEKQKSDRTNMATEDYIIELG